MDLFTVSGKVYIGAEVAAAAAKTAAEREGDFVGVYSLIIDDEGRPQGILLYSIGPEGELEDSDESDPEYDYTSARMG